MIHKLKTSIGIVVSLLLFALAVPVPAQATSPVTNMAACGAGAANFLGLESWDSCLQKKYGTVRITELNDIWLIVLPIIEDFIKAGGYLAVGFLIWGGIKYIKSQGDPKQISESQQTITNALIGLIITILSVAIVTFVAGAFVAA
jgi:hypothetical protein